MEHNRQFSTKKIVMTGLMAALTVAGSYFRIVLPLDIAGTTAFHLGNIMCALSGILLGPWLGGLAAGLGSAMFDMLNPLYISEAWITFMMKGAYGLSVGLIVSCGKRPWGYGKAVLGACVGAATYAALYLMKSFFYNGLLLAGLTTEAAWLTLIGKLPATAFNAAVAIIFAPVLAISIRNALKRAHLSLE